jgi:hypothetical protein
MVRFENIDELMGEWGFCGKGESRRVLPNATRLRRSRAEWDEADGQSRDANKRISKTENGEGRKDALSQE